MLRIKPPLQEFVGLTEKDILEKEKKATGLLSQVAYWHIVMGINLIVVVGLQIFCDNFLKSDASEQRVKAE